MCEVLVRGCIGCCVRVRLGYFEFALLDTKLFHK